MKDEKIELIKQETNLTQKMRFQRYK